MLFSTPQPRRASSAWAGTTSLVRIRSDVPSPAARTVPSMSQIMASPWEWIPVPSAPARHTDAVKAKLWKALVWLVIRQECWIG